MKSKMTDIEFKDLARKCHDGIATEEERSAFDEAYQLLLSRYPSWKTELMGPKAEVQAEIYQNLLEGVFKYEAKTKVYSLSQYLSAAVVLIIVGFAAYFFMIRPADSGQSPDIVPGSNTAILTLGDGRKIDLSEVENGASVEQTGIQITKSSDGQLLYHIKEAEVEKGSSVAYNTIETPKGGQYQVVLPDGTKVWLNAASSLKFPLSFSVMADRVVELKGEAYFEVKEDQNHPFKVMSIGQEVKVLGTHFNINSYLGEESIKTTLLEGSVKVSSTYNNHDEVIIKPGEQAILTRKGINVMKIDIEQVIDWKNGDFIFQHESLKDVMGKIARWYNVQVVYDKDVNLSLTFSGQMSRSKGISEILKGLESTGEIKFEIKETTVTVKMNGQSLKTN